MKILIFLAFCFALIQNLSLRKENQISFQSDSSLFSIGEEVYNKDYEMSSSDICVNLKEISIVFGPNSTDLYNSCDYSYYLLGKENKIIQNNLPLCYLNIADVFCSSDIVFLNETIEENIRSKIIKNLNGCAKQNGDYDISSHEYYYKCPGFNYEKKRVENQDEFCEKLESKDVVSLEGTSNFDIEDEDSRVYTFVKKEVFFLFYYYIKF